MPKVLIAGAGIAGVSTAYYLSAVLGIRDVTLCDPLPPLTLTSDKSTECYRNWWPGPDPSMVQMMNRSIDLLEGWANASSNMFRLNRRGYLYVTSDSRNLAAMHQSAAAISGLGAGELRVHGSDSSSYQPSNPEGYLIQPEGADLFLDGASLRQHFPYLGLDVAGGLHARRAGWLSAQQLGQWLFDQARESGARFINQAVGSVSVQHGHVSGVVLQDGTRIAVDRFVNAAGPLLAQVGGLVGTTVPVFNEVHRKLAFRDSRGAVPRNAPMLIWNDAQTLAWTPDMRSALSEHEELRFLLGELGPGAHCRPEGGTEAATVLGLWEYHPEVRQPTWPIPHDPTYPETVLRGLATMIPAIGNYLDRLPDPFVDGGYYTKTKENRPLVGPMGPEGAFIVGALSGFGVMAGAACGELCALHVTGSELPIYESAFRPSRYQDPEYLELLDQMADAGQL